MGGEEAPEIDARIEACGLPPRGRGREMNAIDQRLAARITPAWAGKRSKLKSYA